MKNRIRVLVIAGTIAAAAVAHAQPVTTPGTGGNRQLLDGIAAVAGDEIVLMSDVLQRAQALAQQSPSVDPTSPEVQREMLNSLIDEKLILTKAREDSIVVSEQEVMQLRDRQIAEMIQRAGGEQRLEQAYGRSMDALRREALDVIRQQLLVRRMMERRFEGMKVTDREIQEFFTQYRDSLPALPEQIELQQIVLKLKPGSAAKQTAIVLARSVADSLRSGGDFAEFAARYSSDPASAREGGDLGKVTFGSFVKEFEAAIKKLGINEISDPVETEYGIHVIQLLDKDAQAYRSRHILFPITESQTARDSVMAELRSIRERALAGENFADLARKHSQDENTRGVGGTLGKFTAEQLPANLRDKITMMQEGQITEPAAVPISPSETGFQIIRVARRIPAHRPDLMQDRETIESYAARVKQSKEYEKWVAELRKEMHWEIKTNF